MNRPRFIHGVVLALIAAIAGELLFVVSAPLLGSLAALHGVIIAASLGYALYLLRASGERLGRLTTLAAWLVATSLIAWWSPPLPLYLVLHVSMIWLVRSLYFYAGLLPALADLGLNALAVAAVVWASVQSGSLMLALWCFFLLQALFVAIPPRVDSTGAAEPTAGRDDDRFEQARRAAELALRKLSSL